MSNKANKTDGDETITIKVEHMRELDGKVIAHAFKDGKAIRLELDRNECAHLLTCIELVIERLEDSIKPRIFKKPDEEMVNFTNVRIKELKELHIKLKATIVSYGLARVIMADRKKKGAKNNGNRD